MRIYRINKTNAKLNYLSASSTLSAIWMAIIFLIFSVLTPAMANESSLTGKSVGQDVIGKADLIPQPKFTPDIVVRLQLDALANNDRPYQNAGIEIAFRFAYDQCWMTDAVMRFEITSA